STAPSESYSTSLASPGLLRRPPSTIVLLIGFLLSDFFLPFPSFSGLVSPRRRDSATTALKPPERAGRSGPGEKRIDMELRNLRDGGVRGAVRSCSAAEGVWVCELAPAP